MFVFWPIKYHSFHAFHSCTIHEKMNSRRQESKAFLFTFKRRSFLIYTSLWFVSPSTLCPFLCLFVVVVAAVVGVDVAADVDVVDVDVAAVVAATTSLSFNLAIRECGGFDWISFSLKRIQIIFSNTPFIKTLTASKWKVNTENNFTTKEVAFEGRSCYWDQIWHNFSTLVELLRLWPFLRAYLVVGKIKNLLRRIYFSIGQIFITVNGQILNR